MFIIIFDLGKNFNELCEKDEELDIYIVLQNYFKEQLLIIKRKRFFYRGEMWWILF